MFKMCTLPKSIQKTTSEPSPIFQTKNKTSDHMISLHPVLQLQKTIGNQKISRLIQAKLKIGHPKDKYEQGADRVTDEVIRMPVPQVQRQAGKDEEEDIQTKPIAEQVTPLAQRQTEEEEEQIQTNPIADQITPIVQLQTADEEEIIQGQPLEDKEKLQKQEEEEELQKQAEEEEELQRQPAVEEEKLQMQPEEEDETLQTKENSGRTSIVPSKVQANINTIRGSGKSLPKSARTFFEPRFGHDFSQVRVYNDSQAAEAAREVKAKAFTVGRDVVFGSGQYDPETIKGRQLLAHELTHVVQQTSTKCEALVQCKKVNKKQPERIWRRDPFAMWGQRGNRGISWGHDGPIPNKYRSEVLKALDLVYGLGKNKEFLRKFHHVVITITKGSTPRIQDMWKLISFFFKTLDRIILHLADTSKDPKIREFINKPSPGGPEEGFSYPGRPDVWLMEYRLKQGPRKIANTVVHEAAHVVGVPALLWFDLMIQAIEKASGFSR